MRLIEISRHLTLLSIELSGVPEELHQLIDGLSDAELSSHGDEMAIESMNNLLRSGKIKLIPENVSDALEDVYDAQWRAGSDAKLVQDAVKFISATKRAWLHAPANVLRYSLRNFIGDVKTMLKYSPTSFFHMGDANALLIMHAKASKTKTKDGVVDMRTAEQKTI